MQGVEWQGVEWNDGVVFTVYIHTVLVQVSTYTQCQYRCLLILIPTGHSDVPSCTGHPLDKVVQCSALCSYLQPSHHLTHYLHVHDGSKLLRH